jgi:MHS family proline/betaine transporter-like MFS transporter
VIFAGSVGTAVEFYDFGVYGYLTPEIAKHFFSSTGPATAFLVALAVFTIAFIARPVGSLLFGNYGDRCGRKAVSIRHKHSRISGASIKLTGRFPSHEKISVSRRFQIRSRCFLGVPLHTLTKPFPSHIFE